MKTLYALYTTPESAQRAVNGLHAAGIHDRDITIMSSEPLEEYEFGKRDKFSLMPWLAGLGAVAGLLTGYFLTSLTQVAWPLNTGGMPIVSMWPNLIIIFELTMLGAVLTTVVTLLVTAALPSRRPSFYDPEISDGKILVAITNPPPLKVHDLEKTLRAGGTGTVKSLS